MLRDRARHILLTLLAIMSLGAAPTTRPDFYVTRRDLAIAYVGFERALARHRPESGDVARVNREFDRAAMRFFTGDRTEATRIINGLTHSLLERAEPDPSRPAALSLRVRVEPEVADAATVKHIKVRLEPMYNLPGAEMPPLRLVIRDALNNRITEAPITDPKRPTTIELPLAIAKPGAFEVCVSGEREHARTTFFLTDGDIHAQRTENQQKLDAVKSDDPAIVEAERVCRARNALLSAELTETDSNRFFGDPLALLWAVRSEIAQIERGSNPYSRFDESYYRPVFSGGLMVPAWVFAPAPANPHERLPLVIALHGAGGDESMFFHGYGAGLIRKLAGERRFVVICPSTYWVLTNPRAFDAIVAAMSRDYPIDRERVYLLGHSMGAMAAGGIAAREESKVAAACLIAGGGAFPAGAAICPTLLLAAELDPLFPVERFRAAVEQARRNKQPVEWRELKNLGHSAVTAYVLEDAIDFLLSSRNTNGNVR